MKNLIKIFLLFSLLSNFEILALETTVKPLQQTQKAEESKQIDKKEAESKKETAKPKTLAQRFKAKIQEHPYITTAIVIAMIMGGGYAYKKRVDYTTQERVEQSFYNKDDFRQLREKNPQLIKNWLSKKIIQMERERLQLDRLDDFLRVINDTPALVNSRVISSKLPRALTRSLSKLKKPKDIKQTLDNYQEKVLNIHNRLNEDLNIAERSLPEVELNTEFDLNLLKNMVNNSGIAEGLLEK